MLQIFRKKDGAVSVFLTIILVPMIVVSCLFVDACRAKLAEPVVSSAGDLTLNTALTQYDATLNDYYGLMASSQNVDEFLNNANEYFQACITSQGVSASEGKEFADEISGLLTGRSSDITDLLQISETEGSSFTIKPVENGTLENPALMKKEIVEFMKYRAPIDGVSDVLQKFKDSSKDLTDAQKNADLVDKKQKFYEEEGELVKKSKEAYDKLQEYINLNITQESVSEMKSSFESVENDYKNLHIKMVKDLYNTQRLAQYSKSDLYENWKPKENEIQKGQVNSYINNAATSIRDFVNAAGHLDNVYGQMPKYQAGTVYDIQYWVACNEILQQNNYYSNYVSKAQSLCKNMAKLKAAMDQLSDEEKEESYTLKNYKNVDTYGEKKRSELYEGLSTQYENLKKNYITNSQSAYNQLAGNLGRISKENIDNITTGSTDEKVREIANKFNEYYTKYDNAYSLIDSAVGLLKAAKSRSEEYQEKYRTWKNAADQCNTTMGEEDRKEIADLNDDVFKRATPEKIQELIDRLNNVKSLLGNLKKAIDEYKYNGTSVRKIDSYSTLKNKSGVNSNKISCKKQELEKYTQDSFKFTTSSAIGKTGITDANNPAIDKVNTPDFYNWMKDRFQDYDEEKKNQAEKDKEEEEKKHDDKVKDANQANSDAGNEIKDIADRPSAAYAALLQEGFTDGKVKASKVASIVSGLFSDFSGTVNQTAVDLRDDLYTLDYIMNMFSYDTFEKEGKYHLCGGGVNLSNYESNYNAQSEAWNNEAVTFSENKTLTNKMINSSNNYSYGNEVEYIIYGNSNEKNKKSAYGTIFAIRYALNLPPEFQENWNDTTLKGMAIAIESASSGIIPAPLFKLVVVLGLTAAETASDMQYLKNGMPVELVKNKDQLTWTYAGYSEKAVSGKGFFYSDYLKLILFTKLTGNNEYAVYARIADVIQANMGQKISNNSGFVMKKANVYYSAEANLKVEPLMLNLPLTSDYSGSVSDGIIGQIKYKAYKGY